MDAIDIVPVLLDDDDPLSSNTLRPSAVSDLPALILIFISFISIIPTLVISSSFPGVFYPPSSCTTPTLDAPLVAPPLRITLPPSPPAAFAPGINKISPDFYPLDTPVLIWILSLIHI